MSAGQARVALTERRGASVTYQENFKIGYLPAKVFGWSEMGPRCRRESKQVFIQTPWVAMVFYMPQTEPPDPDAVSRAMRVLETFELPFD